AVTVQCAQKASGAETAIRHPFARSSTDPTIATRTGSGPARWGRNLGPPWTHVSMMHSTSVPATARTVAYPYRFPRMDPWCGTRSPAGDPCITPCRDGYQSVVFVGRGRQMRYGSVSAVIVSLIIGIIAAGERGYVVFSTSCTVGSSPGAS